MKSEALPSAERIMAWRQRELENHMNYTFALNERLSESEEISFKSMQKVKIPLELIFKRDFFISRIVAWDHSPQKASKAIYGFLRAPLNQRKLDHSPDESKKFDYHF